MSATLDPRLTAAGVQIDPVVDLTDLRIVAISSREQVLNRNNLPNGQHWSMAFERIQDVVKRLAGNDVLTRPELAWVVPAYQSEERQTEFQTALAKHELVIKKFRDYGLHLYDLSQLDGCGRYEYQLLESEGDMVMSILADPRGLEKLLTFCRILIEERVQPLDEGLMLSLIDLLFPLYRSVSLARSYAVMRRLKPSQQWPRAVGFDLRDGYHSNWDWIEIKNQIDASGIMPVLKTCPLVGGSYNKHARGGEGRPTSVRCLRARLQNGWILGHLQANLTLSAIEALSNTEGRELGVVRGYLCDVWTVCGLGSTVDRGGDACTEAKRSS